jgi:plasmid maintenance system antidote protein VapI
MPARLQIQAKDCSPLGLLILQYLEEQHISMNRLAEMADIPQPRLRGACFKGTCPTPETLRKLSKVMGMHHLELYTLAYEGRIAKRPEDADDNYLNSLIRELFETAREIDLVPPKQRPSKAKIERALMELGFVRKGEAEQIKTLRSL